MAAKLSFKPFRIKPLYIIGGVSALAQLLALVIYSIVIGVLEEKPTKAAASFEIYTISPIQAFFRGDFLIMILMVLDLGTIPAFGAAVWKKSPVRIDFTSLFSLITVLGAIFTESNFSLLHLGSRYIEASSETARNGLIAAGEVVIAADLWNITTAYLDGIFLQGSGVVFFIIMLRSKNFHIITAISGLLGNAFHLVQHTLHPFASTVSTPIQMVMGIFNFIWYPILARDFLRLSRKEITQ